MSKKLDTVNQESLHYSNEILNITVLGGIKLEGLDRMRVTLKIALTESSVPPVRHNLDLYNDNQLEKLTRKTAERLEIGTSVIAASLAELTEQLEAYRLEQIKQAESEYKVKTKPLSTEEVQAAQAFLRTDPSTGSGQSLMERTNEMIGKSGMIGEESNRLLMYLIFTSRKLKQPLHIVSLGASGIGKTHLQEKVGELIPEEDKIEITTLSENAFYYFGQRELKNKLILIEDLDGLSAGASSGGGSGNGAFYALRELQTKKRISKTIAHKNTKGETRTIHLIVEGPVSVSGCTTQEHIYEDNANRSFLIYLDESKEQDKRIMEYQRAVSARRINKEIEQQAAELLRNTQRILEPIAVVNPFAELLNIPEEVLKPRRTNNHYLQFIEVITYYHQFQREQKVDEETGEIFIETTLEDVAEANKLLKEILLRKSDELTGACRNYFEKLKLYSIGEDQKVFTNRELSNKLRIPVTTIKRYHLDLFNSGYLRISKKDKLRGYEYEIVSYEEYQKLKSNITSILDANLQKLEKNLNTNKKPNSPQAAQRVSEPLNKKKISKIEV